MLRDNVIIPFLTTIEGFFNKFQYYNYVDDLDGTIRKMGPPSAFSTCS